MLHVITNVVRCMTVAIIKEAYLATGLHKNIEYNAQQLQLDVCVMRKSLLCYREKHDGVMRYGVTYDTGWHTLNK